MKSVELKLICELMKNSRRSDRELAKAVGVSQPTISRMVKRLEKQGVIKEYTMIPDFVQLGYEIMGITCLNVTEKPQAGLDEMMKATVNLEKKNPHAGIMILSGIGAKKNRIFIDLYQNYTAYTQVLEKVRQFPFADVDSVDTFMVSLRDEENYRILSMSAVADHLLRMSSNKSTT